jgi:hypothetical protein
MSYTTLAAVLATAALAVGCTQTAGTPAPVTSGPMDPNSRTVFTLALQPDSISGCIMGDASMTRPMTLTVTNNTAVLLTDGGIHYSLDRVRPNVYAGGYYMKIVADLSARPKRLAVSSNDGGCQWAATAA